MNRKIKIGIVGILLLMIMIPAAMSVSSEVGTGTTKGSPGVSPTNVAKTYVPTGSATVATTPATTTTTMPQIAWVRYGPISVDPYRNNDWYVSYGGSLRGTPVLAVSLSIPWSGNGIGHRYSINTESNYMYNSGAYVQVSSGDDYGVPTGTYINLIGIY
jgi:hypothetical protein